MQATAHPDDEPNGLLALYRAASAHACCARHGDARRWRPERDRHELFDALGCSQDRGAARRASFRRRRAVLHARGRLRLLVQPAGDASRSGGGRRFSAISCGTSGRCGPTCIVSMSPDGTGGGQHHQASAVISPPKPFRAAADPSQFPEQMREGLRPWQVKTVSSGWRIRRPDGRGGRLGRSGGRGRTRPWTRGGGKRLASHRRDGCHSRHQHLRAAARLHDRRSRWHRLGHAHVPGRVPMVPLRPDGGPLSADRDGPPKAAGSETSLFEGIDVSLAALARYAGERRRRR